MLATVSAAAPELSVLAGRRPATRSTWSASLSLIFDVSREVLRRVTAEIAAGCLESRTFLKGRAADVGLSNIVIDDLLANYPIRLESPFENTASIAGGLWSGRTLFGDAYEDALAKLSFSAGTLDLPMHVHEHSDRFIVVAAGSGHFWWSEEGLESSSGFHVESVEVRPGDVLVFTRGLMHTFSAPRDRLLLLSFHSPEIAFDDPRQFTLPSTIWTPRMTNR